MTNIFYTLINAHDVDVGRDLHDDLRDAHDGDGYGDDVMGKESGSSLGYDGHDGGHDGGHGCSGDYYGGMD